ncbi:efflux RND transporter periplasmic adaptor subunit [Aestuariirhabdus haliotis]|uniref:efflux RND transporter periplasmic adaptor subunit n=1 Tax=Aestuariirhabdus haliotis TaxID=2918751 RepID=UPI0020C0B1A9|nr:HlyD family efflux transporter periplasmic adaptor subunit [Aestuariirhabdus haliotis]MCL6420604.1 biotin/lipoyl-binding protein [Aestuariirhabdus haliotis]
MSEITGTPVSRMRRWGVPLLVVVLTALVVVALNMGASRTERQTGAAPLPLVATQVVKLGSYRPRLQLYGRIESPSRVTLTAPITAFIGVVPAREGSRVTKGDLLVALDPRDAELALKQSRAELQDVEARINAEYTRHDSEQESLQRERLLLAIAQRSVERQRSLQNKNLSSKTQLDEALRSEAVQALAVTRIELNLADHANRLARLQAQGARYTAAVEKAALDLSRARVKAPFDARVLSVPAARGARVKSGDALVALFDVSQLEIRAQIPARYLTRLRVSLRQGQKITGQVAVDGETWAVQLDRLAAAVDAGRGGVDALFSISAGDRNFMEIGRTVVIDINLPAEDNLIAVPAQAIYGDRRIYRIVNDQLQSVEITKVGEWQDSEGQWILLKSPALSNGENLMVTQLPGAISGMKVLTAASDIDGQQP